MIDDRWHPGKIAAFLGIGLALYLALLAGSEMLVRDRGDRNPFYRITTLEAPAQDWVVLGASHAMPLDFADMEAGIEAATGRAILNLAATGAGPFVMRLVAERYLADHRAGGVLVVLDGFGFTGPRWNEDRIGDSDFLPRIPLDAVTARILAAALPRLPVTTLADYATGFTKINNPDRLAPDVWEAEALFAVVRRPSTVADRERAKYLYDGALPVGEAYLDDLAALIALARSEGAAVVVVLPPLPERFRRLLPDETALAARVAAVAGEGGAEFRDFSGLLPEPGFYFDSDHLNRRGIEAWLDGGLGDLLRKAR